MPSVNRKVITVIKPLIPEGEIHITELDELIKDDWQIQDMRVQTLQIDQPHDTHFAYTFILSNDYV